MSRRFVVVAPNWLGDAVMALPSVADVRRAEPDAVIDVAARPSIAPLFALVPGVARPVVLAGRKASVETLKAGTYDAALLLPNSFHSAWMAWSAGIPERWGYRNECRGALLTRAVTAPPRVHQAEYYQRLTTALGFVPGPLEPRLHAPEALRAQGRDLLVAHGWDGKATLVAMAPGAAYGGAKRWPAAAFAATSDGLARDGVATVLVGAQGDAAAGVELRAMVRGGRMPIDLIGATNLATLAGVLAHCRALVTNDSGAMHVAAALGVDVIAVFGPTNEKETRPLGAGRMTVLHNDVWCRPCMLRECPLTHRCMTGIEPATVLEETRVSL